MDSLWHKLQEEVVSFKSATEEKRRIYNDLLAKDKKGVAEVAENNKRIQKLMVRTMYFLCDALKPPQIYLCVFNTYCSFQIHFACRKM